MGFVNFIIELLKDPRAAIARWDCHGRGADPRIHLPHRIHRNGRGVLPVPAR